MTAAHCVFDKNRNAFVSESAVTAILGEHDTTTSTESTIPRKVLAVSMIIPHESYVSSTTENDIALLKISEAVDLSVYTPICLPNTGDDFIGKTALVYGKLVRISLGLTM